MTRGKLVRLDSETIELLDNLKNDNMSYSRVIKGLRDTPKSKENPDIMKEILRQVILMKDEQGKVREEIRFLKGF